MNRKILGITVAFLAIAMLATPLVSAVPPVTVQQITGKLGGADYLIRIPSNWQGDLVVFCRGYSHELSGVNLVYWANMFNTMISNGFAYAASSYGAGGLSIKEGVIRTHQLTEYVINNYPVTGKVVLIGMSMGGNIVLELGAKYPDLYDGVLDGFGSKDLIPQYYDKVYYASLTNDADLVDALTARGIAVPPFPFAPPVLVAPLSVQLAAFRTFSSQGAEDMVLACGGTPDEKPKAYERISPIYSSLDISIPTITLHGTADGPVPYQQSVEFKDAVVAAGYGSLYRLYTVTGGQHGDALTSARIPACFMLLMNWIKNGVAPAQTMPW